MQCLFSKQPYKIERIQWQVTAFPQKKQKNTKNNSALKLRWMFHEVGAFKKTSNINLESKIKNSCWPTCFRASGGCCDDAPAATSIILIAVVTFTVALCFSCSQQVQLHVTSYKQKQRHRCFTPCWPKVSESCNYSQNFSVINCPALLQKYIVCVCLTILIVLIMLPFCLCIFLSLFLLVVMMVFFTCYSLYNFNLREKNNRSLQRNHRQCLSKCLCNFFFYRNRSIPNYIYLNHLNVRKRKPGCGLKVALCILWN